MKKYLITAALTFGIAASAQAWTITEDATYLPGDGWMDVDVIVNNDSIEDIVAFGVGLTVDLYDANIYFEPYESNPWFAHAVSGECWGETLTYVDDYTVNYANFFGTSWDETFGGYSFAFITVGRYNDAPITPGTITSGFGYGYSVNVLPNSPAVVMFDQSGTYLGETGYNNTNPGGTQPVPEPATMFLFGTGLATLVGYKKRQAKK